ncbi:TetR/AcrR family transcriptional regulator [Baekduia sp. Peel2402]|uniref:TetR/AcrR family transcriptional regulator n=1 Tax=Baekduia sp. Peel2402 TaxID=3458296 RepID=UPI00403E99D9
MGSGRTSPRHVERKAETRRELVRSAATVFAEEGFHGASLQQIAATAGFTTGAIYGHFGGKDELFLAVFESFAETRVAEMSVIEDGPEPDPAARARALADQWMARQDQDPAFLVVTMEFFAHALRRPALLKAFAERQALVRQETERVLVADAAQAGAQLPLPAKELAAVLRELGVGLTLARLADPDAIPARLYGKFVEALYRLMLTGPPPAVDAPQEGPTP